jgi:hypothetical protein
VEVLNTTFGPILALDDPDATQLFDAVNQTVYNTFYDNFWPITNDSAIIYEIENALNQISPAANATGNVTIDQFNEAADSIVIELFKVVVEDFGFEAPGGDEVNGLSFADQANAYESVFTLIFGSYFHSLYHLPN